MGLFLLCLCTFPGLAYGSVSISEFDSLIFLRRHIHYDIIQTLEYGVSSTPGGGIYLLSGLKNGDSEVRDLLQGVKVSNGRYKGKSLSYADGDFRGAFGSMDLSFDGRRIVFSWTRATPEDFKGRNSSKWYSHDSTVYHLFTMNVDGTDLRQLTATAYDEYQPCFLPNGRIAFISTMHGGNARCNKGNGAQPCGTLHSIKPDGSDLIRLSYHETAELQPSVTNDGMLVYTRWDYVDRDFNAAHHLWTCFPDGRDPRSPHGNYPLPFSTIPYEGNPALEYAKPLDDGGWRFNLKRNRRPWSELWIRAMPHSNTKFVAIGSIHHGAVDGQLISIDISIPDDGMDSQVKVLYPRGADFYYENWGDPIGENPHLTCPWPLDDTRFLAGQGTAVTVVDTDTDRIDTLFSAAGNDPSDTLFRVYYPIPLKSRTKPPILPTATYQGEREGAPGHNRATISVTNVYESDLEWPENTTISSLRIIQIAPMPWGSGISEGRNATHKYYTSYSSHGIPRLVLGSVPVESDGSAYFEAPVGKLIYFQAVDEKGMAVQSMRSGTYVHPGEQLSCAGCHEDKWSVVPSPATPIANTRPPSPVTPDVSGSCPVSFRHLVYPVFKEHCIPCHVEKEKGPDMTYASLEEHAFYFHASKAMDMKARDHGGSRSIPGRFGARAAKLLHYLDSSHYDVQLTDEEFHRVTLWLDANSMNMEDYVEEVPLDDTTVYWPIWDVDPDNPTGVESTVGVRPSPRISSTTSSPDVSYTFRSGVLRIQVSVPGTYTANIKNLLGRTVYRETFRAGDGVHEIALPRSAAGIYVLSLTGKGFGSVRRMPVY